MVIILYFYTSSQNSILNSREIRYDVIRITRIVTSPSDFKKKFYTVPNNQEWEGRVNMRTRSNIGAQSELLPISPIRAVIR